MLYKRCKDDRLVFLKLSDDVYGVWFGQMFSWNGKFVKVMFNVETSGDIVFRESILDGLESTADCIKYVVDSIVLMEKCSVLENKSVSVHGEFLVVISLDLITKVTLNESARAICTRYRKDVSVLFERDSECEAVKSGEVSENSVQQNESKAISFIRYEKCLKAAEKDSKDVDKSKLDTDLVWNYSFVDDERSECEVLDTSNVFVANFFLKVFNCTVFFFCEKFFLFKNREVFFD